MSNEIDMYGWTRCTHEGIGMPGCSTCDPDKNRCVARLRREMEQLTKERDELKIGYCSPLTVAAINADLGRLSSLQSELEAVRADYNEALRREIALTGQLRDAIRESEKWIRGHSELATKNATLLRQLGEAKEEIDGLREELRDAGWAREDRP